LYLEQLSFYLLAYQRLVALLRERNLKGLFFTKVATKKMIGAYELIVAGLYKVP